MNALARGRLSAAFRDCADAASSPRPGRRALVKCGALLVAGSGALLIAACGPLLIAACGGDPRPPAPTSVESLAPGSIARVGSEEIAAATVAAIAAAERIPIAEARDRAVFDALFAAGARTDLPDLVPAAESTVLARALMRMIWREARTAPVSEEELADVTAHHFVEFDRPAGARVVHAVVRIAERATEAQKSEARALAARLRSHVEAALRSTALEPAPRRDGDKAFEFGPNEPPDDVASRFTAAVSELEKGKLEVTTERLPVVAADGRLVDFGFASPQYVLEPFAKAATALGTRGDVSDLVATDYGFHVIALLERTAEYRVARVERLRQLSDDIARARARRTRRTMLEQARARSAVEVATNADGLMEALARDAAAAPR